MRFVTSSHTPSCLNKVATETIYGFHVIKVHEKQPEGTLTLDTVREEVLQKLKTEQETPLVEEYVEKLRENADIQIFSEEVVEGGCITEFGITSDTVIFLTTDQDWCSHCTTMEPIVEDLRDAGTNIFDVEFNDEGVMEACLEGVKAQGAPQFICAGSGETIVGTSTKENLASFAADCK